MLLAPWSFQTPPAQQNSKTQRPFLLRNLRRPVPPRVHHPLLAHLQQLQEGKKKPSDETSHPDSKEQTLKLVKAIKAKTRNAWQFTISEERAFAEPRGSQE